MKQHPRIKKFVVAVVLCLLGMGFGTGSAPAQNAAPNVARISFVQGSVQLLAGQGTDFQQAVINMPVLDGSRLQAGGDGQAEVEFGDGSVARLTPNSGIQFDHLGQDQVQLQQTAGLGYYELNVGEGHPLFTLQFAGDIRGNRRPTLSSVWAWTPAGKLQRSAARWARRGMAFRPSTWRKIKASVPLITGPWPRGLTAIPGTTGIRIAIRRSPRRLPSKPRCAMTRPIRRMKRNDLDADGIGIPWRARATCGFRPALERAGILMEPAIGPTPTFGYTWVSSYPWGWLPYHCGAWSYYSFGWGWAPGGCGRTWSPVIAVIAHPPGWKMPLRPPGGSHPISGRLVAVDRGPEARGPWTSTGPAPRPDHEAALNLNGRPVAPVNRVDMRAQSFTAPKGTAPGTRAVLSGAPAGGYQRPSPTSAYTFGGNPPPAVQPPRPNVKSSSGGDL